MKKFCLCLTSRLFLHSRRLEKYRCRSEHCKIARPFHQGGKSRTKKKKKSTLVGGPKILHGDACGLAISQCGHYEKDLSRRT